jgi:hypothetical protein
VLEICRFQVPGICDGHFRHYDGGSWAWYRSAPNWMPSISWVLPMSLWLCYYIGKRTWINIYVFVVALVDLYEATVLEKGGNMHPPQQVQPTLRRCCIAKDKKYLARQSIIPRIQSVQYCCYSSNLEYLTNIQAENVFCYIYIYCIFILMPICLHASCRYLTVSTCEEQLAYKC